MIVEAGPSNAVSFSDETSPDTRNTKQRHVSIHAQVRREFELTWYYELIKPFEKDRRDELKSIEVLPVFISLTPAKRGRLWETLKDVQINITDSLPYQERTKRMANDAFKRDNAIDFIRQRAIANDPFAKQMLELLNNQTAESLLLDAPSRNLTSLAWFAREYPVGGYGLGRYLYDDASNVRTPPEHKIPLSQFKSRTPGAIVRTVTQWTSQSAGVFSEAIDKVSFDGFRPPPMFDPVQLALRRSHGFDEGHKNLVNLTEEERKSVARRLSEGQWHRYEYYDDVFPFETLHSNLDSRKSFYVQAADIAAGIAKLLYEHGGIFTVASNFEYVMFNGKRITQSDAYDIVDEWRRAGYLNLDGPNIPRKS